VVDEASALRALGKLLDTLGIRWVLAGALAANRYRSAVRLTAQFDLLLADLGPGLAGLRAALTDAGWEVRVASPGGEVLRLRHTRFGAADLMIAGTDYQRQALERSRLETLSDSLSVRVLSPEDVIVHKLIAARNQDLADIEAILSSQIPLDEEYVQTWAKFWEVTALWQRTRAHSKP
jgi:hypothetical protein